jgi:hypothetical protein
LATTTNRRQIFLVWFFVTTACSYAAAACSYSAAACSYAAAACSLSTSSYLATNWRQISSTV